MLSATYNLERRGSLTLVILAGLFIVSFLVPLTVGLKMSGLWSENPTGTSVESDGPFKETLAFGALTKITGSSELTPQLGQDFMLASWFKLRRMPQPGERVLLISKYERDNSLRPGYAIGLIRDRAQIKPLVYWGDGKSPGKWYTFAEVNAVPREWFMLGLTFEGDRYLGLHSGNLVGEPADRVKLLGGYDLEGLGLPTSPAEFAFGSGETNNTLRGKIGAFGVISKYKLAEDVAALLADLVTSPTMVPDEVKKNRIRVWSRGGSTDLEAYGMALGEPQNIRTENAAE